MYQCPLHGWYSFEAPCPTCHVTVTTTPATNTEIPSTPKEQYTEGFQWTDIAVSECMRMGIGIDEFKKKWHKCKYCNVWTVQPDDNCYAKPETGIPTLDRQEEKIYSQSQYEQGIRDAFYESRRAYRSSVSKDGCRMIGNFLFNDFEDYLQSMKQNKEGRV